MEKILSFDVERCGGCGACVVACMDQNDTDLGQKQPGWRRLYQVEDGQPPAAAIAYLSAGCQHCQDSPCLMGCPTGALAKHEKTGAILVDPAICIGCHSCAMACPFGVPRYDHDDKLNKCRLCLERVEAGLEPACVRVCPLGALSFQPANELAATKETAFAGRIVAAMKKGAGL